VSEPFNFYTRFNLVNLLGMKAKDPGELLEGLKVVPQSSIYHHTHRFLQQHNYLSPEPPNDFAYWLTNVLNLKELGEAFASIDTVSYETLDDIRKVFVKILDDHISRSTPLARCAPGEEFHFMSCTTFVLPTKFAAADLGEFVEVLQKVSVNSLYYHIFEARLKLRREGNDFARWCESLNEKALAAQLSKLDPYSCTLETLRARIIYLVKKYAKH
jgi:hypothetical protein